MGGSYFDEGLLVGLRGTQEIFRRLRGWEKGTAGPSATLGMTKGRVALTLAAVTEGWIGRRRINRSGRRNARTFLSQSQNLNCGTNLNFVIPTGGVMGHWPTQGNENRE